MYHMKKKRTERKKSRGKKSDDFKLLEFSIGDGDYIVFWFKG